MNVRIGVLMLVHEALDRAAEVARHWNQSGCPVVIHVDSRVGATEYAALVAQLAGLDGVHFDTRRRCEWGTWSLVEASQSASELMLRQHPDVTHVYLASGACLPLRPITDLRLYIKARPNTDFIESVAVEDVPWAKGGLDEERFTYTFPFAWKRRRTLFDAWVSVQRLLGRKRRLPGGIQPHLGSQWWCLTRQTLERIASDPRRGELIRYFRKVWIPDESYYQTLVRLYECKVESRSLTLSKFDFQGKPHIFYDDHIDLLRRSQSFVARKIWPDASGLYAEFLSASRPVSVAAPQPGEIDKTFARAVERRTRGRDGLNSAARHPNKFHEAGLTAAGYAVFHGFDHLFEDFRPWAKSATRLNIHGRLFAPERAMFADGSAACVGGLTDDARLRDYNPVAFLQNLIWNTRGETQGFVFGPEDAQPVTRFLARDANARIYVVTGTWAVSLYRSGSGASAVRKTAAVLQQREAKFLSLLREVDKRARVHVWSLAEFLERPSEVLQTIVDENGALAPSHLTQAPVMHDLCGLGQFLQDLKNQGMQPHLAGDVSEVARVERTRPAPRIAK